MLILLQFYTALYIKLCDNDVEVICVKATKYGVFLEIDDDLIHMRIMSSLANVFTSTVIIIMLHELFTYIRHL
jgi:hypothetical protein